MIGKTVSHYKILEKLGEGGMGVVYKAEDLRLHRFVALKFLPSELMRDADAKARFTREAQAAAALDHPDICTIYEIDEAVDRAFISMAYIDGERLRDKIDRGPLKLEEVVKIAVHVALGLQAAHEKGIVHRDIKSANVMLTSLGQVKVMDFGLAKLASATMVTREGMTLGTAAYMSPEQAGGEETDNRTDIWSLGVVLYEMLTGHLPFRGEYQQALMYQIMNAAPEPITSVRTGVPLDLERVVTKCLEKNRDERYQTAGDLIADLRHLQRTLGAGADVTQRSTADAGRPVRRVRLWYLAAPVMVVVVLAIIVLFNMRHRETLPEEKSIAVLPFVDMSPERDQEYFCDGMTEELINRLSRIQGLRVPARTSAFMFKGKSDDIRDIGSKLKVQAVLEGSVRKAGNELRIMTQLINVADGYHLWSETYDCELEDIFAIQDKISTAIVNALKLRITSEEKQKMSERPIDNVAAYECYLKAYDKIWRFSEGALDSADQYLHDGVAIVGDNALLYSAMALVYWQYVNIGAKQEDCVARSEEYAKKALALDPDFPTAHEVLATIYKDFLGNPQEALLHFRRALAVNPNELNALRKLAYAYIAEFGKPAAALPLMERARQVDPLEPWKYLSQGMLYFYDGQYPLALEQYRKFYEADTENPFAQFFYAWMLVCNNERNEAFSIIDESARLTPDNVCTKFGLMLKYGVLKDRKMAFGAMTSDFQKTCKRDPEWSYYVALLLASLNAKPEALDWLENAVNQGFINYPALERIQMLDNLRGEERFKKLMERVKYEWEHFKI
ncbi:MAG: protein kinase [Candidatus Krumholzibacteria bacterium]|nr:protein kinase [Candidatus Krumholzibacteria bacterium]